jgi:hypothetical protein
MVSLRAHRSRRTGERWITERLDDPKPTALQDLLGASTGVVPIGAPSSLLSLEVRRTAARTARVWRETTRDGRLIHDERIVTLAKDGDPIVRREGTAMLEPTSDEIVTVLQSIATDDSDPRIRLIAYVKLPKSRQEAMPLEQRP